MPDFKPSEEDAKRIADKMAFAFRNTGRDVFEASKALKNTEAKLNEAKKTLGKTSDAVKTAKENYAVAGKVFTQVLMDHANIMRNEVIKDYKDASEVLKKHANEIQKGRDLLSLSEDKQREVTASRVTAHKFDLTTLRENLEFHKQRGLSLQLEGGFLNKVTGITRGLVASGGLAKLDVATKAGEFLGLLPETIGTLAKSLGVFAAVAWAADEALKSNTAAMASQARLGFWDRSAEGAWGFSTRMIELTAITGKTQEQVTEWGEAFRTNMGGGIRSVSGQALSAGASMVDAAEGFAAAGKAFGLDEKASISLGAKLGSLARTNIAGAQQAFISLGLTTQKLNTPIEALIEPMEILARQAGETGQGIGTAIGGLNAITATITKMAADSLPLFKGMRGPQVAQFAASFTKTISSIPQMTIAAMGTHPGESFDAMIKRMTTGKGATVTGRIETARDLFSRMGILQQKGAGAQAQMGMMLGIADFKEALMAGGVLQTWGKRSAEANEKMLADYYDRQFTQAKSWGEGIMRGADPLSYLGHLVFEGVHYLATIAGYGLKIVSSPLWGLSRVPGGATVFEGSPANTKVVGGGKTSGGGYLGGRRGVTNVGFTGR